MKVYALVLRGEWRTANDAAEIVRRCDVIGGGGTGSYVISDSDHYRDIVLKLHVMFYMH